MAEWHRGIYLRYSNHSTFENNVFTEDTQDGIYIGYSSYNNTVVNNTLTYSYSQGIQLMASGATPTDNNISNNFVCYNSMDIEDDDSNLGFNNTCNTTYNFNDTTNGNPCTNSCSSLSPIQLTNLIVGWNLISLPLRQ